MKEVDLQKKIKDAVNAHGGHALKASNQFLIGVSDLSLKLCNLPHAYMEVKLEEWPKRNQAIPNNMTPLQKKFLSGYQKAGGISLLGIFTKKERTWHLAINNRIFEAVVPLAQFIPLRKWEETADLCTLVAIAIQEGQARRPSDQLVMPWLT